MLALDRHRQILQELEQHGSVRTIDLADRLAVTNETVRRDMAKLENEGLLRRTHGGAIRPELAVSIEQTFDERIVENLEAKRIIAQTALSLVNAGESIFIDGSSTALQLALLLGDFHLQVVTHSLLVAEALRNKPKVDLLMVGGQFDRTSRCFLGPEALMSVRRYRTARAFCSGNGIEPSLGISEINREQAILKEVVCSRCTCLVYLADRSKLGKPSSFYFADTAELDIFVTDAHPEHPVLGELSAAGVEVLTSEDN